MRLILSMRRTVRDLSSAVIDSQQRSDAAPFATAGRSMLGEEALRRSVAPAIPSSETLTRGGLGKL